jgi:hypothetical protein
MFYILTVNKKRLYPECTHLDGIEQTQIPTRWIVEGRLPLRETLKTVHHTAIVTSGRRGNETTSDVTTSENQGSAVSFGHTEGQSTH